MTADEARSKLSSVGKSCVVVDFLRLVRFSACHIVFLSHCVYRLRRSACFCTLHLPPCAYHTLSTTITNTITRNLKDAVAAGLTSVPKNRSYNRSGRRSSPSTSTVARGGGRRGRYESSSSSSAEPEFGWQQRKSPRGGDGDWDDRGEEQNYGFDDYSGGGGGGDDVEAFEGEWGGEQEQYRGGDEGQEEGD